MAAHGRFRDPDTVADPQSAAWVLGPASVSWRVLTHPWVPLVGGIRTLMIEALHPLAMRGVHEHSDYLTRPMNRLQRTAAYVSATALGTEDEAEAAARVVRAVHRRVRGLDPVTGRDYSADDPHTQVWIHFVQWYSYLVTHRVFIGGLTPDEEDRFVAEGVPIATYVGTPADLVPASVPQAREYFASMRSQLCVTDAAREAIDFLTGRRPRRDRTHLALLPLTRAGGAVAMATVPRELRRLMGTSQPRAVDAALIAAFRAAMPALRTRVSRSAYERVIGPTTAAYQARARAILRGGSSSGGALTASVPGPEPD